MTMTNNLMTEETHLTLFIPEDALAIRIDKWLSTQIDSLSRESIQDLIENKKILLNGLPVKKKDLTQKNGKVDIFFASLQKPIDLQPIEMPLEILFEDDAILVINKPANLVVHPGAGNTDYTLVHGVLNHLKDYPIESSDQRPGIVHRLDKDTSGVMVIAKTKEAHFKLAEQFANREVKKSYLAITLGKPTAFHCDLPIKRDSTNRQSMCCDLTGKKAETAFSILANKDPYYLVLAKPITGRTHQIRVHLKHLKAPIFGDTVYGNKKKVESGMRQMLHAFQITFFHPLTKELLTFQATPPSDFKEILLKELNFDLEKTKL
jgi:23S rRNA pseudouridine1911/1915/1917 synthase